MSARGIRRARQRELQRAAERAWRRSTRLGTAAGAATAGAVLFAPAANAATFEVTSLADDGSGGTTLREATVLANTTSGDDVVTFQTGLSGTITLDGDDINLYDEGVQVVGPGANVITIDGGGLYQPFDIGSMNAEDEQVTISGLTLTNGYSGTGGAVRSEPGTGFPAELTITDSVLTGSTADGGDGGAIFVSGGSLTLTGSTISGNVTTERGGGVYVRDTDGDQPVEVTIRNTTISNNEADDDGGGVSIRVVNAGVLVEGSTITGNDAANDSGGIQFYGVDGEGLITASTITDNYAESYAGGGAFDEATGGIRLSATTIAGNRAAEGAGGIAFWESPTPSVLENSTVSGNVADSDGNDLGAAGGVVLYNPEDVSHVVRNSTVTNNRASDGGGIYQLQENIDGFNAGDVGILSSTIVAGNVGATMPDLGAESDLNPPSAFEIGFSLIGSPAGATVVTAGPNLTGVDPQLGPLANNGGPTQTHAPAFTSPVLDMGSGNGLATDQRGAPRTFDAANVANAAGGDGTDIGSVELLPGGRLALAQCKGAAENVLFAPGTAIVGSDANDVIVGTDAKDQINSGKGKDKVCAAGGNDSVKAGAGKDNVAGQAGKDRIKGNGGNDKLQGNAGRDTLKGGGGKDTLKGGGGKDKLRGGPGKDKLKGGGGKDSEQQ